MKNAPQEEWKTMLVNLTPSQRLWSPTSPPSRPPASARSTPSSPSSTLTSSSSASSPGPSSDSSSDDDISPGAVAAAEAGWPAGLRNTPCYTCPWQTAFLGPSRVCRPHPRPGNSIRCAHCVTKSTSQCLRRAVPPNARLPVVIMFTALITRGAESVIHINASFSSAIGLRFELR
ncbi:hypothetical protein VUR80DRAFT_5154 [Thermomyces stellatus]